MGSKATPGPWEVVDQRQIYSGDTLIAEVTDTAEGLEGSDRTADANAVLISAAPDLLEACRFALPFVQRAGDQAFHVPGGPATVAIALSKIEGAIAKAEGGTDASK